MERKTEKHHTNVSTKNTVSDGHKASPKKHVRRHKHYFKKYYTKFQNECKSYLVNENLQILAKNLILCIIVWFGFYVAYTYNIGIFSENNISKVKNSSTSAVSKVLKPEKPKPLIPEYIQIDYYTIEVRALEDDIRKFIIAYFGKDDINYVNRVTKAYMKLFNSEKDLKQNVLYYIALCSVESNFKMSARSKAGAVGISQIMPSVWAEVVKTNYGITREELYIDPYKNIYAGYRVWDNYRRKGNGSIKAANDGYLGTSSGAYVAKINERYVRLMGLVLNDVFKTMKQTKVPKNLNTATIN